ncbi:hypothetical protein AMECASPLE_022629 [Ameca splendens]|uniref:C2H2-type domain-containing protein n=1 Tax=Ameca splendens TaxID=208324 RepID=A0ABV0XST1_9TELE
MSSVQHLREFIRERLTAAAEEIFSEVEKTIVRYEEDVRLLGTCWKPQIKLTRIDVPTQHVDNEEEALTDHQLCNQLMNLNEDQEQPEPPRDDENIKEPKHSQLKVEQEEPGPEHIKEEQEEVWSSQEKEHLALQMETVNFSETRTLQQTDFSKEESNIEHLDSNKLSVVENMDQAEIYGPVSQSESETVTDACFQCDVCGRVFKYKYNFQRHHRVHSGEKPFRCKMCGKVFAQRSHLKEHMTTHTGERPFSCETCGKGFSRRFNLKVHRKTHTDERPFSCETCGKRFRERWYVKFHRRTHTGEKPFSCDTCDKSFYAVSQLNVHRKTHRGRRQFSCATCGISFTRLKCLTAHTRVHGGRGDIHMGRVGKVAEMSVF